MKRRAVLLVFLGMLGAVPGLAGAQQLGQQPPAAPGTSAGGGAAPGAGTKPQVTVGEGNVVRLPASTTTVTATNVPGVETMAAEDITKYGASFTITDNGLARGPELGAAVQFGVPAFVGRSVTNGLTWRVPIEARVPLGTSHPRLATIGLGVPKSTTYAIEYTVTTKPAAAAQWAVRGSADTWTVSWSDPKDARIYGLVIENQDERLVNVRLAMSTLKDTSGHAFGRDRMRLVEAATGEPAAEAFEVAPNTVKSLFIRLDDPKPGTRFGTFDGVLRFTADGSSALKDLPLKIQASSFGRKVLGVLLTLAGLLLTVLVSALLRPQLARLQVRRATAGMRAALGTFVEEVSRTIPADVPSSTMTQTAKDLSQAISDETLNREGLLPPPFSLPGAEPTTEAPAKLKERLETVSKQMAGLYVLLRRGAPRLVSLLASDSVTAKRLLQELDDAAATVTGSEDAQAKVDAIHAKIPGAREAAAKSLAEAADVHAIDLRIQALSVAAWALWVVVALVIGAGWIASNVSYGTTLDLVGSFLWGFGITAFGAGIQNLTTASVTTQMNIKIPR